MNEEFGNELLIENAELNSRKEIGPRTFAEMNSLGTSTLELLEENLEVAISILEKQRAECDKAIHHAKTELQNARTILFERLSWSAIPTKKILLEKEDLFLVCNSVQEMLEQNECPDIDRALSSLKDLGLASWTKNDGQEILVEVVQGMDW